jgi:Ankyrin repeats (3 copies)
LVNGEKIKLKKIYRILFLSFSFSLSLSLSLSLFLFLSFSVYFYFNFIILTQLGANPNARHALDDCAIHLAADNGDVEIATLLLTAKADVNALNSKGQTALFVASNNDANKASLWTAEKWRNLEMVWLLSTFGGTVCGTVIFLLLLLFKFYTNTSYFYDYYFCLLTFVCPPLFPKICC